MKTLLIVIFLNFLKYFVGFLGKISYLQGFIDSLVFLYAMTFIQMGQKRISKYEKIVQNDIINDPKYLVK